MPDWLPVVVIIVGVLAFAMFRERSRLTGIERWAPDNGFVLHSPFRPDGEAPVVRLASRVTARGASRWGAGVEGTVNGVPITIGEFETSLPGRKSGSGWHTVMVWPCPGADESLVVSTAPSPGEGKLARERGYCALARKGLMTVEQVEGLLAALPEAQRLLE